MHGLYHWKSYLPQHFTKLLEQGQKRTSGAQEPSEMVPFSKNKYIVFFKMLMSLKVKNQIHVKN